MPSKPDLQKILSILDVSSVIVKREVLIADEISERAIYKIRCHLLLSKYHLEIRFIQTEQEMFYSYQLFSDHPIIRWDNAPHFPKIESFPHHFHNVRGQVESSELKGMPEKDLSLVLDKIVGFLI